MRMGGLISVFKSEFTFFSFPQFCFVEQNWGGGMNEANDPTEASSISPS